MRHITPMLQRRSLTSHGESPAIRYTILRCLFDPERRRFQGDIDGFVDGSRRMAQGGTGALHTVSPVEVHFNGSGDKAVSESTGAITIRFEHDGHQFDCVSTTRFISRLQRVDGAGWKMLTLKAIYERDYISPTLPSPDTPAVPVPKDGRESYKCIAWVLGRKGFTVQQDLPGTDRPSSCEEFMAKEFKWLGAA